MTENAGNGLEARVRRPRRSAPALVAAILSLALTACGFQPLMADRDNAPVSEELSRINVHMVDDRSGQILRNHLLDGLTPRGVPRSPAYHLTIRLSEPRQEIALRRDATAGRIGYTANASFTLTDLSGRTLLLGTSSSSSTYEVTNSEYSSVTGQRSARDRAMEDISADIRQQLAAFFIHANPRAAER